MNRRQALASITPLAAAACGLMACTQRREPKEKVVVQPYNEQEFHAKLEAMRSAFERRFPNVGKQLQPGLSEEEIRRKAAWFPGELSPEVIGLYKWRNGYLDVPGSKEPPFWFRDCVFTPLERVESDYRSMMATYGSQADVHDVLRSSFPFASSGGGWLVLPSERRPFDPKFPRAVVSVFQGISVFFYSPALMADTCAAWIGHPKNDGFGLSSAEEMKIWAQFNPGIFQR